MILIPETVSGAQRAWNLLDKLGEGDAGEVFRVEGMLDRRIAILKRPRKNGFPSDAIRQATQIEQEAQVLAVLARLESGSRLARPPALLDAGKPGSEFSERYFIVISPALGLSLGYLARAARFGSGEPLQLGDPQPKTLATQDRQLVERISALGRMPDLLLLRALSALLDYFEVIHSLQADSAGGQVFGVIWNDVKPDHIFWDPLQSHFTLIDWGNARFLEADGVTKDRLHSRMNDYQQFIDEMGAFLSAVSPDLHFRLAWPAAIPLTGIYTEGILPLRERIHTLLEAETTALDQARWEEADLLFDSAPGLEHFEALVDIHQRIAAAGELPDYANAERYFYQTAHALVTEGEYSAAGELCAQAQGLPFLEPPACQMLAQMTQQVAGQTLPPAVLLSALAGDWHSALWDLRRAAVFNPTSIPWEDWYDPIREHLGGSSLPRPLVALNRIIHTLQAVTQSGREDSDCTSLLQTLKEEMRPRWTEIEPDPPNSGLDYREVEKHLPAILAQQPEAGDLLLRALEQPRLQAGIVLDAWERKDFEAARRALRQLLLWDPDRSRLFQADRALSAAAGFLADVSAAMIGDETLADLITRLELVARELRNQVGPAVWLDAMLDAFKQLRKGAEPTDVLVQHPEIRDELGWLVTLEPRRPLLASPDRPLMLERLPTPATDHPLLLGSKESPLGREPGIILTDPLDTWVPEARGSSARLFLGESIDSAGERRQAAFKLMRPDRAEYSLPLFKEEASILTLMHDVPGVMHLLECGFIQLEAGSQIPPEDRTASARDLSGQMHRFGPDSVHNFLGDLEKRAAAGWIPYLALEKYERGHNLLLLSDTGHNRGHFLPILEALVITQQICDILEVAHTRNIVYRDHKILHYYWQSEYNGVFMIDWNVARRHPGGLSPAEVQFDLVQFAARALHVIFTGRSAPGALPMGPNRPEEIEAADRAYAANWTYDDQRLPKDIKDLLEAALSGAYDSARRLREDAHTIYTKLAELI